MYLGIDNEFILNNIFGDNDIFKNAQLINLNWQLSDERMEISIKTPCKVLVPPKKWTEWDYVYIKIDFFGIEKLIIDIDKKEMYIESYCMREDDMKNIFEFNLNKNRSIYCKFEIARIQNIKPIKRDEDI